MAEEGVLERSQLAERYQWNRESVFASEAAWKSEVESVSEDLEALGQYEGRLGESPETLAEALESLQEIMQRVRKVFVYAGMSHRVDTRDQGAAAMYVRAQSLYGRALGNVGFVDPELLAIGEKKLRRWMGDEPRLAIYSHYVEDLFRKQAHVRSSEVEELLGMLADPFSGVSATAAVLRDGDLKFPAAVSSDGREIPVTQGNLLKILNGPDRETRRTAWQGYVDTHLAFKNTLATSLVTSIKQDAFQMRARGHGSTLEAALFENAISAEVFHNLIDVFRANLSTWHRYWEVKRRALGVTQLRPYDIWAPLTPDAREVPYEQAVDWICAALSPLGEEYVEVMRRGCLEERWVDVYPSQGKASGAFSYGSPGTHPFILMNYVDSFLSLSTLAHELGHSMHSYFAWRNQPIIYSGYSIFVAEVASTFHQAMVRAHLLDTQSDPLLQIGVIEEAMANFYRYFLVMPTLARFELETHERIERGEGLNADGMIELMADLIGEAYGEGVEADRERIGISWAIYPHLYADYYVYQYGTGISGAHAIARRFLSGEEGMADGYLRFLKAGGSLFPLDALKLAGIDLARPEPVEEAFAILSGLVDRLEELTAKEL
ncbi:MAG: oligoendopeptidase F [Anaerolineae bacterium]